jgi:lipopolysaccharide export system protein LptC
VGAIKAKTDNLPSDPADASVIAAAFATTDAKIDAVDDLVDTEVAAIKTDTAAIKLKTDSLTFTKALELDANIQSVNGVTIVGDGAATPWGP